MLSRKKLFTFSNWSVLNSVFQDS